MAGGGGGGGGGAACGGCYGRRKIGNTSLFVTE